jgi:hypothetical protein
MAAQAYPGSIKVIDNVSDKPKANLLIGTPVAGSMMHETYVYSLLETGSALEKLGYQKGLASVGGAWTAQARNILANEFLKDKSRTHLFFVDADIGWKPKDVVRLIEADVPIIGALYPRKHMVWEAAAGWDGKNVLELANNVMRRSWPFEQQGEQVADRVPVDWIQTGFMLIRRDAFEKIREHKGEAFAFYGPQDEPLYEYFGYPLRENKGKVRVCGEDFAFCEDARAAGLDVWRLLDVELKHVGQVTF